MKLEKISIENFRGIERMELDLRDELDRVQAVVPIVGPNTSGKTSVLDAISLCLGQTTELWAMRPDLVMSPSSIVRRGSVRARIVCEVQYSDEEIAAIKEVYERTEYPKAHKVPSSNRVTVGWEYPDPDEQYERGKSWFEPSAGHLLFKGRIHAARNLHIPGVSVRNFLDLGGIYLFDQKRTGLGQRKSARLLDRAARVRAPVGSDEAPPEEGVSYTRNPRQILLDIATRAQAPQHPEATEREDFERLCELFAQVCKPHRIKGLYNTESGLDMEFEGPQGVYLFDGLSSGQTMLLLLLLQFARNRIHRSIVMIDELELHLHPLWQTRLYQSLEELGTGNQILFTTHSSHLRDLLRGAFVHCTGELGDRAVKKEEA